MSHRQKSLFFASLFSTSIAAVTTAGKKPLSQSDLCYHYAIKIKKLAGSGKPDAAYAMLSKALATSALKEPNKELFNTLISACAASAQLTLACDAYKMMTCRNISPDSITFLSLMNAYANAGNTLKKALMQPLTEAKRSHYMTRMMALYEEAQARNILTTPIFNVLLKGVSWLGTLDHLHLLFPIDGHTPMPTPPDHVTYTTAIFCVAYCGGSAREAETYFEEMKLRLFQSNPAAVPKDSILAMLIAYKLALTSETNIKSRLFKRARDLALFYGIYLRDTKVLDAFLNVCKNAKEYKYGLEMYDRLVATGNVPIDDSLEKTYISLLINNNEYQKALQLFFRIKRPSRLAINTMLEGCRKEQQLDDCIKVFQIFANTPNLVPNIHSCEHALMCIMGPHSAAFGRDDATLPHRIESVKWVLEFLLQREKKIFNFFTHAALAQKIVQFAQAAQDPGLLQVVGKTGIERFIVPE